MPRKTTTAKTSKTTAAAKATAKPAATGTAAAAVKALRAAADNRGLYTRHDARTLSNAAALLEAGATDPTTEETS